MIFKRSLRDIQIDCPFNEKDSLNLLAMECELQE